LAFTHDASVDHVRPSLTQRLRAVCRHITPASGLGARFALALAARVHRAIFAVRKDGFTVQNSMYALRHKQLQFLCVLASWLCCLLACRFSYKQIYEPPRPELLLFACRPLQRAALTYCVVLRRDILRQCSPSVFMSVYPSVVFGIR